MLKHNYWSTGLDYMERTLLYLALQGWYDIDSAKVYDLLSKANKWQNSHTAHHIRLQHCQDEPFFCPVLPRVYHLRGTHILKVCRSFKLTSPRDALEGSVFPNFGQRSRSPMEEDWGHEDSGLVLG